MALRVPHMWHDLHYQTATVMKYAGVTMKGVCTQRAPLANHVSRDLVTHGGLEPLLAAPMRTCYSAS